MHRRHVGAAHGPRDEAALTAAREIAAFESINPAQRIRGAIVKVGERGGGLTAA